MCSSPTPHRFRSDEANESNEAKEANEATGHRPQASTARLGLGSQMNSWEPKNGIFILVDLQGELADKVHAIQERFDPRMANFARPHFTLIGSSGAGPIPADTPLDRLREVLDPIAASTEPMSLHFERPVRFMQTNTFALPLDPHGPLRALHDRIKRSGLSFGRSRHAFTPHVTLSHYRTPTEDDARELLSMRIDQPFIVDHLVVSLTEEPRKPSRLFELELAGSGERSGNTGK